MCFSVKGYWLTSNGLRRKIIWWNWKHFKYHSMRYTCWCNFFLFGTSRAHLIWADFEKLSFLCSFGRILIFFFSFFFFFFFVFGRILKIVGVFFHFTGTAIRCRWKYFIINYIEGMKLKIELNIKIVSKCFIYKNWNLFLFLNFQNQKFNLLPLPEQND